MQGPPLPALEGKGDAQGLSIRQKKQTDGSASGGPESPTPFLGPAEVPLRLRRQLQLRMF